MRLLDWQPPDLSFDVRCTKGAYIRVLAEDLAAQLGTIGHLAALRRLGRGAVCARAAMVVRGAGVHDRGAARYELLLPVDAALTRLAAIGSARRAGSVPFGRVRPSRCRRSESPGNVRIYAAGLGFLGLGEIEADRPAWCRCDLFRRPDANRA